MNPCHQPFTRDPRLTYKARGILAVMASYEGRPLMSVDEIVAYTRDGRDSVVSGLEELSRANWLIRLPRTKRPGARGRAVLCYQLVSTPPGVTA